MKHDTMSNRELTDEVIHLDEVGDTCAITPRWRRVCRLQNLKHRYARMVYLLIGLLLLLQEARARTEVVAAVLIGAAIAWDD